MSIKQRAAEYGLEFIAENPGYIDQVNDLYYLMLSEIDEGGSPDAEFESFIQSVEQLIET